MPYSSPVVAPPPAPIAPIITQPIFSPFTSRVSYPMESYSSCNDLSFSLFFSSLPLSLSLSLSCSFHMADHHHGNSHAHRGTPTNQHCLGHQGSKVVTLATDNLQFPMIKVLHYQYRNGFDSPVIIIMINSTVLFIHTWCIIIIANSLCCNIIILQLNRMV